MTLNLFADPTPAIESISLPDAELLFLPSLFTQQEADALLQELTNTVNWQQERIRVHGQEHNLPRLTAWYGDTGRRYRYSGITVNAEPWSPTLLHIKSRVEEHSHGTRFNSVLLNLYRNGNDGVAWHADDEPELGTQPVIASVSFGQERPFQLRHRHQATLKYSLPLPHGSLLIMQGNTQHAWQHQIPKSTKAMQPRINLTFRVVGE
ncbi:MAG: alpha-ketoglutarate-dependent dioxygenase AlkB [Pseudomonadales bacterium]|nr:alpha-ketoglutarate-dependent dioxygenase AlkB [Pseudomonadales bacterium]